MRKGKKIERNVSQRICDQILSLIKHILLSKQSYFHSEKVYIKPSCVDVGEKSWHFETEINVDFASDDSNQF